MSPIISSSILAILPVTETSLLSILGFWGVIFAFLYILSGVLRLIFRQFDSDLPLVALETSRIPLLLIVTVVALRQGLGTLPASDARVWSQKILLAAMIGIGTYWLTQILTQVVLYALRQYAERSEVMWDDVAIPILQNVLPFLMYVSGALLFLQTIGLDMTGLLVAIGGAAFILGFALQDILANFFSGLVLLIDTPFRFGDVIQLPDGSRGIIKHIGLRLTELYLIDTHSQIYIPNAEFQGQSIINLSRPTNHYYHTISIPIRADVDPALVISMMEKVVLAHPDTMGKIEQKLEMIDDYYGYSIPGLNAQQKREAGRRRLMAEQAVNATLVHIEDALAKLSDSISLMEKGGLDAEERRELQRQYLDICEMFGLETRLNRGDLGRGARHRRSLVESNASNNSLIHLVRAWYQCWLKDPNLFNEDQQTLKRGWEQRIEVLKLKLNKLCQLISEPRGLDTRLDDQVENFRCWLRENFKSSRNEWQDPKIWVNEVQSDYTRDTTVRFYVDDIALEHCERGQRIISEVRREIVWHLRRSYLCN